jgi:uncharacterized membrane protein YeaQ/YmgE (transglycosylase-associated protein family)
MVWSILGFVVGLTAGWIINKPGDDVIPDIVLGIIGAVVGGVLFSYFATSDVRGLNLYSVVVAIIAAIFALVIYHAIVGRTGRATLVSRNERL